MLAEAALAGAGFTVHLANDGEEVLRRLEDLRPDCVILDVNMPRVSGVEACRRIRQRVGPILPILILWYLNTDDVKAVFAEGSES